VKNLNPVESYITVSDVFPGEANDFNNFVALLKKLSKTDAIIWCSRLNMVIGSNTLSPHEKQQFGVKQFLSSDDINYLNKSIQSRGKETAILFFRGQILELLRWIVLYCDDYANDGMTFEDIETRRTFAKVLLIASDIWGRRVFKHWSSNNEDIEMQKKLVLGSVRKIIEAQTTIPELEKTCGRGWALFNEYLPRIYCSFYEDFQKITGLNIQEYFICMVSLITNFMQDGQTNIFHTQKLGDDAEIITMFQRYIRLESQSVGELQKSLWKNIAKNFNNDNCIPDYDYKPLREKPIFVTDDGRAIILDPIFYCERASMGAMFHISKTNGNQIFSQFGNAFENYSCDILRRMYPESITLHKRLFCDITIPLKRGISIGQIDACLNDVTEVVLFEMKAVFLKDSVFLDNYEELIEFLRERYGITNEDETIKVKGVGQLARIINEVVLNKLVINEVDFSRVQKIYPILVVHDSLLHAPLYGEFLASEFYELIKPEAITSNGEMIKKNTQILPLILMTIDELENIESSCEHYGLKDFLNDYSKDCTDRKVSINNYVSFSDKYNFYHNKYLASKSLEIIERTRQIVFKSYKKKNDKGTADCVKSPFQATQQYLYLVK